jgi:hypothetical protein
MVVMEIQEKQEELATARSPKLASLAKAITNKGDVLEGSAGILPAPSGILPDGSGMKPFFR